MMYIATNFVCMHQYLCIIALVKKVIAKELTACKPETAIPGKAHIALQDHAAMAVTPGSLCAGSAQQRWLAEPAHMHASELHGRGFKTKAHTYTD